MQSAKVVLACVLGSIIGALMGLHFGHLWIAAFTGGILGYCSFEWRTAVAAVPCAWAYASNHCQGLTGKIYDVALGILLILGFLFNVVVMPCIFVLGEAKLFSRHSFSGKVAIPLMLLTLISCIGVAMFQTIFSTATEELEIAIFIPVYYWVYTFPKFAFRSIIWLLKEAPSLFCAFIVKWFRLVHSELRLLCMIDAAIGAGVGYFFHSPIIGGIAGGVLGFVNYEILSIRVMKLVPSQQSIFARFS